jgi:hypothetical protein
VKSKTGKMKSLIQSSFFTYFNLKSDFVNFLALLRMIKQYKKKINSGTIFHKPGKKSNRYAMGNPIKKTSSSDTYISFFEII